MIICLKTMYNDHMLKNDVFSGKESLFFIYWKMTVKGGSYLHTFKTCMFNQENKQKHQNNKHILYYL